MRIVYVSTLERGGPVSHLLDLAPRVAALGADITVVCASDAAAARFRAVGLDARPVPMRSKWDLRGASDLWPLLRGADLVHTQDRRAGLFGRVFARVQRTAVVHTYHGLPEEIAVELGREHGFRDPAVAPLRRAWLRGGYLRMEAVLARLGVVITPSHSMADYLVGAGMPRARIRVIPSGIDVARDAPGPKHDPPVLATIANLESWKGIDLLVDACARLDGPVRLEVYGDGEQRASLERRAEGAGVDARFHGHVPGARRALLEADVFALPSRADNLPVAVLEAMAAALPVVATRVGGTGELVDDGVTGLLVPPDDVNALAAALAKVLADEDFRSSLGRAGAARARAEFDPDDVARRVLSLYTERCASSR